MDFGIFKDNKKSKFIDLLIANEGKYVYYIQFTDEVRLSRKKFPDGTLIVTLDKDLELLLGPVTYVGQL